MADYRTTTPGTTGPRAGTRSPRRDSRVAGGRLGWLRDFFTPGQVVGLEAAGVETPDGDRRDLVTGFFRTDDPGALAAAAGRVRRAAGGVTMTLNPLTPALLGGRADRLAPVRATAEDVLARRWLPVLVTPTSPDAPPRVSRMAAAGVRVTLQAHGFPDPVVADDGARGLHLLYRVDLPEQDGGLIEAVLHALADRWDTPEARVDRSAHRPDLRVRLYGEPSGREPRVPGTPWSGVPPTMVYSIPRPLEVAGSDLLADVAGAAGLPWDEEAEAEWLGPGFPRDRHQPAARPYVELVRLALQGVTVDLAAQDRACERALRLLAGSGLTFGEAMPLLAEWAHRRFDSVGDWDLGLDLREAYEAAGGR